MPDVFLALSDTTRREILRMIAARPHNAGEVAAAFPQQRPAISKHLAVLKQAGLLAERRDRQRRLYSLNPAGLVPVRAFLGILAADIQPAHHTSPESSDSTVVVARSEAVVRVAKTARGPRISDMRVAPISPARRVTPAAELPLPAADGAGSVATTAGAEQPSEAATQRPSSRDWDVAFD